MHSSHGHAGPPEAARQLGISRQRFYQIRATYPDFPKPVAELASGPVWHTTDIDAWQRKHADRPAGRPATKPRRSRRDQSP